MNIIATINQHSVIFLGVGTVFVIAINIWKWRSDIAYARQFAKGFQEVTPINPTQKVSVLVAAWNEQEHIQKHIENFLSLSYQNRELILCAGGGDDTLVIARSYEADNVIVLEQQAGEGKQKALRHCFERAKGDVIFLTDADCYLDDDSFERTLSPVLMNEENVTTGTSLPTDVALKSVFIASQAASQLYGAMHAEHYVNGIFGRNCAVKTNLLSITNALEKEAPTGTDYVLAKTLLKHKIKIHHVPHSLMQSEFNTSIPDYIHQQWRWAKNVYFWGKHFGEKKEVQRIFFNTIVGLLMMILPVAFIWGLNLLSVVWILLFLHALFGRWRYINSVERAFGITIPKSTSLFQPVMLLIDFVAWARPLPDFIFNTGKETW